MVRGYLPHPLGAWYWLPLRVDILDSPKAHGCEASLQLGDDAALGNFLSSYHDAHGTYPLTLEEAIPASVADRERYLLARDGYDHPLHYRSDGQQFLLVSYGADGVADSDPLAVNDPEIASPTWACNDADRDTKYSSNGSVQLCGK